MNRTFGCNKPSPSVKNLRSQRPSPRRIPSFQLLSQQRIALAAHGDYAFVACVIIMPACQFYMTTHPSVCCHTIAHLYICIYIYIRFHAQKTATNELNHHISNGFISIASSHITVSRHSSIDRWNPRAHPPSTAPAAPTTQWLRQRRVTMKWGWPW